jgi:hypothetical protein
MGWRPRRSLGLLQLQLQSLGGIWGIGHSTEVDDGGPMFRGRAEGAGRRFLDAENRLYGAGRAGASIGMP